MPNTTKYRKYTELQEEGWDVDYHDEGIHLHGADETPEHLALKAIIGLVLRQEGRPFETEAELDGKGRVDVLDWGPIDGKAIVYEVETDCSQKRKREKADQYAGGVVRDVIVFDTRDAPDGVSGMYAWVREQLGFA